MVGRLALIQTMEVRILLPELFDPALPGSSTQDAAGSVGNWQTTLP